MRAVLASPKASSCRASLVRSNSLLASGMFASAIAVLAAAMAASTSVTVLSSDRDVILAIASMTALISPSVIVVTTPAMRVSSALAAMRESLARSSAP